MGCVLRKIPNIGDAVQRHTVLRGPVSNLTAVRPKLLRLFAELPVFSAVPVFPCTVICSAEQKQLSRVAERPSASLVNTKIHSLKLHCILKRQHIASFLMHSHKVVPGHIYKRIMGRKYDVLRGDSSFVCYNTVSFNGSNSGALINRQFLRDCV